MFKSIQKVKGGVPMVMVIQALADTQHEPIKETDHEQRNSNGLQPIYNVSRVFGLLPFSIIWNSNAEAEKPKIKKRDILWLLISVIIYSSLAFYKLQSIVFQHGSSKSSSVVFSDKLLNLTILVCGILMFLINLFNRSKLVGILKNFTNHDKKVSVEFFGSIFFRIAERKYFFQMVKFALQNNFEENRRNAWVYCTMYLMTVIIFLGTSCLVIAHHENDSSTHRNIYFYGSVLLQYSTPTAPLIIYITLLCRLHQRFVALNSILRFIWFFQQIPHIKLFIVFSTQQKSIFERKKTRHFLRSNGRIHRYYQVYRMAA